MLSKNEFGRSQQQPPDEIQSNNQREYKSIFPPRVYVFYHTYSGSNRRLRELILKIVEEQVHQVGQASLKTDQTNWILRYSSVGEEGNAKPHVVDPVCLEYDNLQCEYQGHRAEGHEESTLQQMHNFCKENPEETVVYIHSKGSFHDKELNNVWRGPLTGAALSSSCINALQARSNVNETSEVAVRERAMCNVCGLQFYPIWNLMFPGNMFSAHCSYVSNLVPLAEYRSQMEKIVHNLTSNPTIWKYDLYKLFKVDIAGLDRFSNEQWIGSHPNIMPCDLAKHHTELIPMTSYAKEWKLATTGIQQAVAEVAPRIALGSGRWFRFNQTLFATIVDFNMTTESFQKNRPHEYFLLPGILFRFYQIYGSFPPSDSWIWQYYPFGSTWKSLVEKAKTTDGHIQEELLW